MSDLPGCVVEPLSPFGAIVRPKSGSPALGQVPVASIRDLLLDSRLVVLRGFAAIDDKSRFSNYCRGWGELLEWDFGTVFEVAERESPNNYLFTSGSVPYHWDGAFAKRVPWLQVFQCRESPGADRGGETTFCDTTRVWRAAPPALQARWAGVSIEYSTDKVAHYGGAIRADLVGKHPLTGETTLRFAEPANAATVRLNTPELRVHGIPETEVPDFLADLLSRLYDPSNMVAHAWEPGDFAVADNHALLHGRNPYRAKAPRRLWRVHVL